MKNKKLLQVSKDTDTKKIPKKFVSFETFVKYNVHKNLPLNKLTKHGEIYIVKQFNIDTKSISSFLQAI